MIEEILSDRGRARHSLVQPAAVGKPVLTANQVTVWKGLELLGPVPPLTGLGALFGDPR